MLSILIPVFNYDVTDFVRSLHHQASETGIPFEIRCYDDASQKHKDKNKLIAQLSSVVYKELPENRGRASIRNLLASEAVFENLLFLDCDGYPASDYFIRNYLKTLQPGIVIFGGRSYTSTPPDDKKLYLRWLYGIKRESASANVRNADPYKSFMTNNFLIPKTVFEDIRMDENLKDYGHEDTLFGYELLKRNIPIQHIENPLIHLGLETADTFLKKTEAGIKNLYIIYRKHPEISGIRLLETYKKIQMFSWILKPVCSAVTPLLLKKLNSATPDLRYFDFWKIATLIKIS